jgi:hypothetical protein
MIPMDQNRSNDTLHREVVFTVEASEKFGYKPIAGEPEK